MAEVVPRKCDREKPLCLDWAVVGDLLATHRLGHRLGTSAIISLEGAQRLTLSRRDNKYQSTFQLTGVLDRIKKETERKNLPCIFDDAPCGIPSDALVISKSIKYWEDCMTRFKMNAVCNNNVNLSLISQRARNDPKHSRYLLTCSHRTGPQTHQ